LFLQVEQLYFSVLMRLFIWNAIMIWLKSKFFLHNRQLLLVACQLNKQLLQNMCLQTAGRHGLSIMPRQIPH